MGSASPTVKAGWHRRPSSPLVTAGFPQSQSHPYVGRQSSWQNTDQISRRIPCPTICSAGLVTSFTAALVQAAPRARLPAAGRDPESAAQGKPARHRGAAARKEADPANLDPTLRNERTVDGYLQRPGVSGDGQLRPPLRQERRARAYVPGPGQSLHPEPARRQPRADDARAVPAGHDSEPPRRRVDPVHGPRLVRAQALEPRGRDRHSAGARGRLVGQQDENPAIGAGSGAGWIDAATRLRQPQQPLVGRLADLRLRTPRRRRGCVPARAAS